MGEVASTFLGGMDREGAQATGMAHQNPGD